MSDQVAEIFELASEMAPEQREPFLVDRCGDDAELLGKLRRLLKHHDRATSGDDFEFVVEVEDARSMLERLAAMGEPSAEATDDNPNTTSVPPPVGSPVGSPDGDQPAERRGDGEWIAGKYELIHKLGAGAFGTVWRSHDHSLDRSVAIKFPHEADLSPASRKRFAREAQALAAIVHPHVVEIYEFNAEGHVYIVSRYIDGVDLASHVKKQKVTIAEAVRIVRQIAEALDAAHEQNVIHRDVKPKNIVIHKDGSAYLVDFGLAKGEFGEHQMTMDGQIMGTPAYMAPEVARGQSKHASAAADIYSLGAVLFELVTGKPPFEADFLPLLLEQIRTTPAPDVRTLEPAASVAIARICEHCLQKRPQWRYQSAGELAEDLRRVEGGSQQLQRHVSVVEKLRRWCVLNPKALFALAAACLLMATFVTWFSSAAAEAKRGEARSQRQALSRRLAILADRTASRQVTKLLLAIEAVTTVAPGEEVAPEVEQTLWAAVRETPGKIVESIETDPEHAEVSTRGVFTIGEKGIQHIVGDASMVVSETSGRGLAVDEENHVLYTAQKHHLTRWIQQESVWIADATYDLPDDQTYWGQSLTLSPDNRWLLCGNWQGAIAVMDLSSGEFDSVDIVRHRSKPLLSGVSACNLGFVSIDQGKPYWTFFTDPGKSTPIAGGDDYGYFVCAPDGSWLAGTDAVGVSLWRSGNAEGKPWDELPTRLALGKPALAVSPDGKWLGAADRSGAVRIWDMTAEDSAAKVFVGGFSRPSSFIVTSTHFAMGAVDGNVHVWSLLDGNLKPRVFPSHNSMVRWMGFESTSVLYSVSRYGGIRMNDLRSTSHAAYFEESGGAKASNDMKWLVTGIPSSYYATSKHGGRLRSVKSNEVDIELHGPQSRLKQVSFSPDSRWLLTTLAGESMTRASVWDVQGKQPTESKLDTIPGGMKMVQWSAAGDRFAIGTTEGIGVWHHENGDWGLHRRSHLALRELTCDRQLRHAAGVDRGAMCWFRLAADQSEVHRWSPANESEATPMNLSTAAISPTGEILVGVSKDGEAAYIVNVAQKRLVKTIAIGKIPKQPVFDQTGRWCALVSQSELVLVDCRDESFTERRMQYGAQLAGVIFSPDSRWIVSIELHDRNKPFGRTMQVSTMESTAHLTDLSTGSFESRSLATGPILTYQIVFSADSRWMSCGDRDGNVLRWDLKSPSPWDSVVKLDQQGDDMRAQFIGNNHLLTQSNDGRVIIRDVRLKSLIRRARDLAGRSLTARERLHYGIPQTSGSPSR